ncbi:hypothetical protein IFM89_006947 [Coptis chinensis]|uniref:Crossover junction endonuclease MUS81 n=1 Tax=Coptis chinensis TaxID=261450 RepID=A0A835LIG7_9MAGN|nr:hypothetical protein IFM89_006947 [Coptis chinensis]
MQIQDNPISRTCADVPISYHHNSQITIVLETVKYLNIPHTSRQFKNRIDVAFIFEFNSARKKKENGRLKLQICNSKTRLSVMENRRQVVCPENDELAMYMWNKRQEMSQQKSISDRFDNTLNKGYISVCNSKQPIKTLKEFSQVKGIGKQIIRLMQGFFKKDTGGGGGSDTEEQDLSQKGKKKTKGPRRYVPQKNSVAYALLITLYRRAANGIEFMKKQELIDVAEASGLSRVPIAPELGKGRQGQFVNSPKEWYSGWNAMSTLITKGLVAKSSNPAKYMLTQEGREAARDCLSRSGLADSVDHSDTIGNFQSKDIQNASDSESDPDMSCEMAIPVNMSRQKKSVAVPSSSLEKVKSDSLVDTQSKDVSLLLRASIHHPQEDRVDVLLPAGKRTRGKDPHATLNFDNVKNTGRGDNVLEENVRISSGGACHGLDSSSSADSVQCSFTVRACSSSSNPIHNSLAHDAAHANTNVLMVPPLRLGERFGDVYEVILILDDREQFVNSNKGHRSRKLIENMRIEFKIQLEVRRLPVGDAIWIARHRELGSEYVLDFIVERKGVDDLRCSIKDNRYRDQKLRLVRCGLQKLIYVVEGDPNACDAAETIKTACFTTEILEGFDVQRTSGLGDTIRKYGHLTLAIALHYRALVFDEKDTSRRTCPSFGEFIKKCQDIEKMTVSDVFASQLMQVPQVTEENALAVLVLYPTLVSLAQAYSLLDGDIRAQEEMLMRQSNKLIGRVASKNIFKLVWGG